MAPHLHSRRTRFLPISRFALGLFSCVAWGGVMAQKPAELDYLIRFAAPVASVQEKYIHETLQGYEPGAGVWVDRPNSQVKVRIHVSLDRAGLESTWAGVGLTITSMELINGDLPQERSTQAEGDPYPVLVPTGDPDADNDAFDAAKAAWINAHPEAYQLMTAPREH